MKYTKYGITFRLMDKEDIEMVRNWRNDPVVVRNYEFREFITPEMQEKWFASVNNIQNLYCIIEYQNEPVGVINLKDIDWDKKTFEGGIFIPFEKYHSTPLPIIISFMTTEFAFRFYDWNEGYARVLRDRPSNQTFVKALGYTLCPGQEGVANQRYAVTRESFEKAAGKIRKALSALTDPSEEGILEVVKSELSDPVKASWDEILMKSNKARKIEDLPEVKRYYLF
ncbi:MAG: GNAT family N-acetyltransferase [Bacteroidetes bacterium]|nr:GNAT family N-acetyltransferase [Bacteroidota bacterium]